jgi:GntR family transcriptional regulator, transcriptional repressor for pyruvate dehydrogenase complex
VTVGHTKFERVQRTRSYEAIVDQVRHLIDSGQLGPGDQLPPERDLAVSLDVSRATLREAFRVLEHMGLIESRIGHGRFVAELRPSHVPGDAPSEALEKAAIFDFLEVRRVLEVPMAGLAAERATDKNVQRIEDALNIPDSSDEIGLNSDTAFHLAMAQATHNAVYVRFFSSEFFLLYRLATTTALLPSRRGRMNLEHKEILEAIRRRDRSGAEAAMLRHMKNIEDNLHRVFSQRDSEVEGLAPRTREAK